MTGLIILFILIGFPLIELYFLIEVGSSIGGFYTLAITIFTAVAGIHLIRIQGMQTIVKMQSMIQRGEAPAIAMIEGIFLSIAAIFLVIPGFISDTFGALLLIPPLRVVFAGLLLKSHLLQNKFFNHQFKQHQATDSDITDVEYEDITKRDQISIKKDN